MTRKFGYAIELENRDSLVLNGTSPELVLSQFQDNFPAWNQDASPASVIPIADQGQVGSCQGQSLAKCFQICYFLATGRAKNINSWGAGWCGDGMSDWLPALDRIVEHPGNTFVIYAPDEMSMPELSPVPTYEI